MPRFPDDASVGRRVPRAVRGTVGVRGGIAEAGQAAIGDAVSRFGRGVSQVGEALQERRDTVETATAKTEYLKAELAARRALQEDPDFATYDQRYQDQMQAHRDRIAKGFSNNIARQNFNLAIDKDIELGAEKVRGMAQARERDVGRAGLEDLIGQNINLLAEAEDDETRTELLAMTGDAIEDAKERRYLTDLEAARKRREFGNSYLTVRNAAVTAQIDDLIDVHRNALLTAPLQFGERRQEMARRINDSGLSSTQREKLMERAEQGLALSAVQGAIDDNPDNALANLKAGTFDAFLDPGNKATLINAADREIRLRKIEQEKKRREILATRQARVKAALPDETDAALSEGKPAGIISNEDIDAAYPDDPEVADALKAQITTAMTRFEDRQAMLHQTPQERRQLIESAQPEGEGFRNERQHRDGLIDMNAEIEKALAKDSAAYVMATNPGVREMFAEAGNDPQALRRAVEARRAESVRLGGTGAPLSEAELEDVKGRLTDTTPGTAVAALQQTSEIYGEDGMGQVARSFKTERPYIAAAALHVSQGQMRTATDIIDGHRVLTENKDLRVEGRDRDPLVSNTLGNTYELSPELRSATIQAADALYAKASLSASNTNFDATRYKDALRRASGATYDASGDLKGGPFSYRGRHTLPAAPGLGEDETVNAFQSLTTEDLAKYGNGQPVWLLEDRAYNAEEILSDAQLISIGFGKYALSFDGLGIVQSEVTDAGRPVFRDEEGNRFSERSATREVDGRFVNFPTVFEGRQLSEDEAFDRIEAAGFTDPLTGRALNFFETQEDAVQAARQRSDDLQVQVRPYVLDLSKFIEDNEQATGLATAKPFDIDAAARELTN